jgi:hypothetical protein
MNLRLKFSKFIWIVALLAGLVACSTSTPTPMLAPTAAELPSASVRLETYTPPVDTSTLPPPTLTSTATLTLAPTFTDTAAPTNSPTPEAQFDKALVTSVTNPPGGWQIIVHVPGLKTAYNVQVDSRLFKCVTAAAAPATLFCQGLSSPSINTTIPIVFIDPQSGAPVYTGKTIIPPSSVPTATPVGYFSCPDRGKNIFCETECRIYGGTPCLVVACSDACGPYYGLNNCPQDHPNDGICSAELEQEMKKKYGIP